jgi:homoserine acetyltransferase
MTTTPALNAVTDRRFTTRDFALERGGALPEMTLAFDTYGRLAADGANAILVTHGFTGTHHAAGPPSPDNPAGGWWQNLIGPGKAIDTDRYFAVAPNMLGSSYGSTGPGSINPATGRPYGPDFSEITLGDIVRAQRLMLDSLGVRHLVAVARLKRQSIFGSAFQDAEVPADVSRAVWLDPRCPGALPRVLHLVQHRASSFGPRAADAR